MAKRHINVTSKHHKNKVERYKLLNHYETANMMRGTLLIVYEGQ